MAKYTRNIQGCHVELELVEVNPDAVQLDATNPRLGFSMRQLESSQRSQEAATLLLISQEEAEELKRSIMLSGGVQEPIYLRANGVVAEGNRRVVALRLAKEERSEDPRFATMPAWLIPEGTPEAIIRDLLNEIHLGSVRGWAPYEKALQLRALVSGGLIEEEVAERYRMTPREVKQHIQAANLMDEEYFPITDNPDDAEHRSKFSYFLEFCKNPRLQRRCNDEPDLPDRFATWVARGLITTGERVRRLPRILDSGEATRLLDLVSFDAAEEYLRQQHPEEQEFYALLEKSRKRLHSMTVTELFDLRDSADRRAILEGLRDAILQRLADVDRLNGNRDT